METYTKINTLYKRDAVTTNVYGMVTLRPYSTNLINNIKTLNYEYR